jgi:DNA-binding NarL/FixJ family response regulator
MITVDDVWAQVNPMHWSYVTMENNNGKLAKLLIADDERIQRLAMTVIISGMEGVELIGSVSTGDEAVSRADDGSVDLLVMDVTMPGLDGISATRQLKQLNPHLKVLLLTAGGFELLAEAQSAGADGFCSKESSPAVLTKAIYSLLDGQQYFRQAV